jgi:hypothetical protein
MLGDPKNQFSFTCAGLSKGAQKAISNQSNEVRMQIARVVDATYSCAGYPRRRETPLFNEIHGFAAAH